MEGAAQARAYAEADFSEPHSRLLEALHERLPLLPARGAALDLGCGPADVTLRFARAFPSWTVDGVDASAAMLRLGRERVDSEGLADRVRLVACRLPDDAAPRAAYDLLLSNSLLHHLADPATLWQVAKTHAAPGGQLFVMDLNRPGTPGAARALVEKHASGEPEMLRHDFHASLHAAYTLDEVRLQLAQQGLTHLGSQCISDRHWIVWGPVAA
ncbi:MAG: class I SAM-dependent methyltransferase [Myxococcota bacterium]|jgi:SAM-dependent methyltransferase|nr:class I SAM-dependent methyltransferase [bacterium]MDP6243502.1 class I SAM-dependent methyltransferase [Myxococcota bacterium]MDP7073895.1 class I SAM-dependent methyltransferase [Myxococcota bacterium]MDP7300408.1 class I SAM-dependent methyltransferase [Myxococcota bacterium]MDP7433312.1 class I SAM-dependent methyltransferase [Myxococcota bacterium]